MPYCALKNKQKIFKSFKDFQGELYEKAFVKLMYSELSFFFGIKLTEKVSSLNSIFSVTKITC